MSNPYDFVPAPNIAGAGNYAQMLQQSLSNFGRPKQQQQQPNQPQSGMVPPQNNYIAQLLKSLFGGGGGAGGSGGTPLMGAW